MTTESNAAEHQTLALVPDPLLRADPFVTFWEELWQVPRILWACWYDTMIDTVMGLSSLRRMPEPKGE